ncbi:hypothetical protein ACQP1V_26015 [Microtetraspora malaysiensis]|uniref:hypothetical protein n=1 Tax=Microtetraspora malaysiensis TaxID=161358 RepID=UPI003D91D71B
MTRVDGQWRDERTGAFYRLAWFHRDKMITSDSRALWKFRLRELAAPGENNGFEGALTRYTPGRAYAESWNRGVFGPYLPGDG